MYAITYIIKDLYTFTGEWFCYTSKALTLLGNTQVTGHSFIIAMMKYVIIVHYERVAKFGKHKIKTIFFWINLVYPIYMMVAFTIVNPDFLFVYGSISQANRCLGKSEIFSNQDTNRTLTRLHNLCEMDAPLRNFSVEYVIHICRTAICWFHVILFYCNFWNLLEVFIYCRIFIFMKR
jgi:hypothetical protein